MRIISLAVYIFAISLMSSTLGYLIGYNVGFEQGEASGRTDALMKAAGKCFLHVEKDRQ